MSEKVLYRGNLIETDGFRAYVYGQDNLKKLVNSYEEYEAHINSGDWFDDKPELVIETEEKQKSRRK